MKKVLATPRSALCELGYFGMVSGFPLESMHTLYLLVCKHFFDEMLGTLNRGWVTVRGPDGNNMQLRRKAILDSRIKMMDKLCPYEFDRRVETTDFLGTWKATTYRQFFLYLAYPLLEDLLDKDWLQLLRNFQYFMYLIGGADPNPVPEADLQFAQEIIEFWVTKYLHETNGKGAKPSIHYILHAVQDCRFHQCHFDCLSAFKYENALRYITGDIQSGNCKLEQLKNRMIEREKYVFNRTADGRIKRNAAGKLSMGRDALLHESYNCSQRTSLSFDQAKKKKILKLPDVQVSNILRDSFILVNNLGSSRHPQIVRVIDFKIDTRNNGALSVQGHSYDKKEPLFETPADSRSKHVYVFSECQPQPFAVSVSKIVGKLYAIPRFKVFGLKLADSEMLGNDFSNVEEWVGVALRHVIADNASLY
jgi:hypothetical protein